MNGSSFDPASLPGMGIKPLLSLRRHPRMALLAAVLVLLVGIPFAWIKGQSFYVAEAVFQVAPHYMKHLETDKEVELQSNSQYREFVNHLSNTVTRQDVLQAAVGTLRQKGIELRPPGMSERRFIDQLRRMIYVRPIADTYMVRIGVEDREATHLHELVNAVADTFVQTTRAEQIFGSTERLQALRENAEQLRGEVAALSAERVALAEQLGLTTFADSTLNPYDGALAQARERLESARLERARADAALAAFLAQREVPTHLGRSLLELRLQDNGLQALRNEVVRRTEELNRVMAGLEERHPARQAALLELADLRRRLGAQEAAFEGAAFENFRTRLVATVEDRRQVEANALAAHTQLQSQASDFARTFQHAMRLTQEIRKRDADLTRLRDRLGYLDLETQALGFVRMVTPALPAETPQGIGHKKMFLAVLLAALAAGLAAPLGLDLLHRRIRTVNEAERLLGMPAAGWQIQNEGLATAPLAQEQTRRFAATLIRNRSRGGRNLFGFTGVKPGAGVSTWVLDAALVLGQMGSRVLVVEANAMTPDESLAQRPGLTDHLLGTAPLETLAQARPWRDGTVEVVGIGTARAQGLRRLDLFRQALERWSGEYDFVLCDLPALLLSADAEMAIELIGQVFLVVDAEAVSRGEIGRAKRQLQKLDPEAVGLVVNRLPVFRGAGYLEPLMVETVARTRFEHFMSQPRWALGWELLRMHAARWLSGRRGAARGT